MSEAEIGTNWFYPNSDRDFSLLVCLNENKWQEEASSHTADPLLTDFFQNVRLAKSEAKLFISKCPDDRLF